MFKNCKELMEIIGEEEMKDLIMIVKKTIEMRNPLLLAQVTADGTIKNELDASLVHGAVVELIDDMGDEVNENIED